MAVGLGGEQLWLSPTVANNVNPFNDQSGQGNNGTAQGGLSTVADTGAGGAYSYDFDGTNDYIDCGTSVISNTSFSMSYWFNADTVGGAGSFAGSYHWQDGERSFYIRRDGTKVAFLLASNGGSSGGNVQIYSTTTVSVGTWYHVTATWDSVSGDMELFINGVSEATSTQSVMAPLVEPLVLGAYSAIPESLYNGKQDDIRFFQRVLTQSEITHLATARGIEGRPFDGLGGEQLWLCPSLENSPNDLSGNNNNGVYQGGMGTIADTAEGGSLAYDFDGTNDYIDTGSTTVHQNTLFTYSFWINASASTSGTDGAAGSYETAGNHRGPLASSIPGDNKLTWLYMSLGSAYNPGQQLKSVGDVYDSTWRHVVCEFDGNNNEVKIYIDGTLDSSKTASVPNTVNISTPLKFGAGSGGYTTGRMDDVRVYNRALTQSEITHLATSRGVLGPPGGATHYNPFKSHAFINDFQQRLR